MIKPVSFHLVGALFFVFCMCVFMGHCQTCSRTNPDYTISKNNQTAFRLDTAGRVFVCNETDLCALLRTLQANSPSSRPLSSSVTRPSSSSVANSPSSNPSSSPQDWTVTGSSIYRPLQGSILAQGPNTQGSSFDGLSAISGATGAGKRFLWYGGKAAIRAGQVSGTQWNDNNIGVQSTAFGFNTEAEGLESTAFGLDTIASGKESTAFGLGNRAEGTASTGFGFFTTASGFASTAFGSNTIAEGDESTATGYRLTAYGEGEFASGICEAVPNPIPATDTAEETDAVFTIGNGPLDGAGVCRSNGNAVTVTRNGDLYVAGNIYYNIGSTPYPLTATVTGCGCLSNSGNCGKGCMRNGNKRQEREEGGEMEEMKRKVEEMEKKMEEKEKEMEQVKSQLAAVLLRLEKQSDK